MVDSEHNMIIYKSIKISIGAVMNNLEIVKFVPDQLKTKKICEHAVKKIPFVIQHVLDRYKSQQMCSKAILESNVL